MQKWTKTYPETKNIDVLLFDAFSNHCLANAIEPFRAANTISGKTLYRWRYLSIDGQAVCSSSGLSVATESLSLPGAPSDLFLVVSSYGYRALCTNRLFSTLREACNTAGIVVGLDTGAWLLAYCGVLNARSATIHADVFESFSETFVNVNALRDRYVPDGKYITCGGAMAAFDLVLSLIGEHCGQALRMDVAALFLHVGDGMANAVRHSSPRSTMVRRALEIMDKNLEEPLAIARIAARLGCSQKALQRRFIAQFGTPPARVYRHKRLAAIKALVDSTDLPISEIAIRGGYANPAAMIRAFKSEFGTTPLALRIGEPDRI